MGSVLRRGDKWYVKWTDVAGRPQRRVTASRTKAGAQLLLAELELKVDRQKRGLEALPVDSGKTLGQLCEWWLETKCTENSLSQETYRLRKHIVGTTVGNTPVKALTTPALQEHFDALKRGGYGPASRNKLRGTLMSVMFRARKADLWTGPNHVEGVECARVVRRRHKTLRAKEVALLLAQVSDELRNLFAMAIWTALRKGELCGLQVGDIDWEDLTVWVQRSYDYSTTKGGHGDPLPIPRPLVPFLKDACARTTSKWVFPGAGGKMRTEDWDPNGLMRTALKAAGLVEGYLHTCRRCKAGGKEEYSWQHADMEQRRCASCEMRLWVSAIPRAMTFHDLRHTTATLLIKAKVPAAHVQKILRHASITTTESTYAHLLTEDLRSALEKLGPGPGQGLAPTPAAKAQ